MFKYIYIRKKVNMKIYTKTGDKGTTSLYGGSKVSKNNLRIMAYGTVDELNSCLGIIRSYQIQQEILEELIEIQKTLFHLGAELATPNDKLYLANGKCRLPKLIQNSDIELLESRIDKMESKLPQLTHFILPGGNLAAAHAQLARTVCRRAERVVVGLSDVEEIREEVLKYLNRLSDYLFVLGRFLSQLAKHEEIKWLPNE